METFWIQQFSPFGYSNSLLFYLINQDFCSCGSSIQRFPFWKENSRHSGLSNTGIRSYNKAEDLSSLDGTTSYLWTRKNIYIFGRLSKSPHSPSLAFDPNFLSFEGWIPQSLDPTCLFPVSSTKLANLERLVSPPWLTAVGWERRAAQSKEGERDENESRSELATDHHSKGLIYSRAPVSGSGRWDIGV